MIAFCIGVTPMKGFENSSISKYGHRSNSYVRQLTFLISAKFANVNQKKIL